MQEMDETLLRDRADRPAWPDAPRRRPGATRRLLLGGGAVRIALAALVVATGALGVIAWRGTGSGTAEAVPPPQLREFTLVAEPIAWEIEPGVVVRAWAYNGQVPGPELRVREGDTVRVT